MIGGESMQRIIFQLHAAMMACSNAGDNQCGKWGKMQVLCLK